MQEEATDFFNSLEPEMSRIHFEEGKTHIAHATKDYILYYVKATPLFLLHSGYARILFSCFI